MSLYGGMSKGERNRIKTACPVGDGRASRASRDASSAAARRTATCSPTRGRTRTRARPPIGQRLRRLEPDPVAAPVVQRIFAEFIAGRGLYAIAEGLTRDGIPSPVRARPGAQPAPARQRWRWSKAAVRAILQNPRYTGRQVWNRQRTRRGAPRRRGRRARPRDRRCAGTTTSQWVWSEHQTHPAIIDCDDVRRGAGHLRRRTAAGSPQGTHPPPLRTVRDEFAARSAAARCKGRGITARRTTAASSRPSTRSPKSSTPRPSTSARHAIVPGLDTWIAQPVRRRASRRALARRSLP